MKTKNKGKTKKKSMSTKMNSILQCLNRDNPKEIFRKTFFTDDDISFIKWEDKLSVDRLSKWRQKEIQKLNIGDVVKTTVGGSLGSWMYGHVCFRGTDYVGYDSIDNKVEFASPGSASWLQIVTQDELELFLEFRKKMHHHD